MLLPATISLHQTSRHATIVLHAKSIDLRSIAAKVDPAEDHVLISYSFDVTDPALSALVTLSVRPILHPSLSQSATVERCEWSLSLDNLVLKLTKVQAVEWQALELLQREHSAVDGGKLHLEVAGDSAMAVDTVQERGGTGAFLAKFATTTNAIDLQSGIRASRLWSSQPGSQAEPGQCVSNVQAARVAGTNAVQITAEVAPAST